MVYTMFFSLTKCYSFQDNFFNYKYPTQLYNQITTLPKNRLLGALHGTLGGWVTDHRHCSEQKVFPPQPELTLRKYHLKGNVLSMKNNGMPLEISFLF